MRTLPLVAAVCSIFFLYILSGHASEPLPVTKSVFIQQLGETLDVFKTVQLTDGELQPFRSFIAAQQLSWADEVLDIGSGTGVLGLIALKQGAGKLVATDILPLAIDNIDHNAAALNVADKVETRLVPQENPGAYSVLKDNETFDLIISNPPWDDLDPLSAPQIDPDISPFSYNDKDHQLLKSIITGLPERLNRNGKAWLYLGREQMVNLAIKEASEAGLAVSLRSPGVLFSQEDPSKGVILYTILELMLP